MMCLDDLGRAKVEALRFVERVRKLEHVLMHMGESNTIDAAAVKRASMDLTRELAVLRSNKKRRTNERADDV